MKVVALAGGTGSAKLLGGLKSVGKDLTVVANVGDNFWFDSVLVCPDLDIATYTLAGVADSEKGWGIRGDTFGAIDWLSRLHEPAWFRLGDRDLATCLLRGRLLKEGMDLTAATAAVADRLGVEATVLPLTDDDVQTHVRTSKGTLHLQEFWVRDKGRGRVTGVEYRGSESAKVSPEVVSAVQSADRIVICPANPVTSIGPMLSVPGFARLLSFAGGRVSALSPMAGTAPFSGPAGKLMKAVGLRPDSVGVAGLYSGFLDLILVSADDASLAEEVEALGVECVLTDTRLGSPAAARRLARELTGS